MREIISQSQNQPDERHDKKTHAKFAKFAKFSMKKRLNTALAQSSVSNIGWSGTQLPDEPQILNVRFETESEMY